MSRGRGHAHHGRRDDAEEAIVDALRSTGAVVRHLAGLDLPDLLCLFRGKVFMLECKTGKAKLRRGQELFRLVALHTAGVTIHVVHDATEALAAIGVELEVRG